MLHISLSSLSDVPDQTITIFSIIAKFWRRNRRRTLIGGFFWLNVEGNHFEAMISTDRDGNTEALLKINDKFSLWNYRGLGNKWVEVDFWGCLPHGEMLEQSWCCFKTLFSLLQQCHQTVKGDTASFPSDKTGESTVWRTLLAASS